MFLEDGVITKVRETFLDDATWQKDEQEITGGKVRVLQARGKRCKGR